MKKALKKKKIDSKTIIKKMTITAAFLALSIIFSFLSTFMPVAFLSPFLNLNLSAIFLGALIFIVGLPEVIFASIITALMVFANPGLGSWVGVLVNLLSNLTFIFVLYIINFFLIAKSISNKKEKACSLIFGSNIHYFSEIITVVITALILTILNGFLFTPLYWYVFELIDINSPWFIEAMNAYNNASGAQVLMLGIPNYWGGIFALYMAFNLLNFSICVFGISLAKRFMIHSKVLKRFSNQELGGLLWKFLEC